ncbi:hypothetical protein JZU68_00460, partial [bacterium]|nr:hypothetical protein [bacterium]
MKLLNNLLFALVTIIFASCESGVTEKITYKINEPVFMTKDEFRASVKVKSKAEEIVTLGKICFYDGYLFISEPQK